MAGLRRVALLILAAILVASAVLSSSSPLTSPYAAAAWTTVASSAGLAVLVRVGRWPWRTGAGARLWDRARRGLQAAHLLDLAILAQVAAVTCQVQAAIRLPSTHLPLHNTPGVGWLYLFVAASLAFATTWLLLARPGRGRAWAALLAAAVLSSTLYLRGMAVPEAGRVDLAIAALTLVAVASLDPPPVPRLGPGTSSPALWAVVWMAAAGAACLLSPALGQSTGLWTRWAALLLLAALLAHVVDSWRAWRQAAVAVIVTAGVLPVLIAGLKFASLVPAFGWPPALAYRLHLTDLGGANLIARSVLAVAPLALALACLSRSRVARWGGALLLVGSIGVALYARSWEGFFALLAGLGASAALASWSAIDRWRRQPGRRLTARWAARAGLAVLLPAVVVAVLTIARQVNVYSFNSRLMHWYGALLAWRDHLWLGGGPGNDLIYLPYADQVGLYFGTQVTSDDPLRVIFVEAGRTLRAHAHNLFLEIGATSGLVGAAAFVGFLFSLLRAGVRRLRQMDRQARWLMAGCLGGIGGILAWGMLDVLWVAPPFFGFPGWALAGLLLAGVRLDPAVDPPAASPGRSVTHGRVTARHALLTWLLVAVAAAAVLVPALASRKYVAGFVAVQERRWAGAIASLRQASALAPLDHQANQLLATAYLAAADVAQADDAWTRAEDQKEGQALYLSRLGWLAWLRGDLSRAVTLFEQALEQDPAEIIAFGFHTDLGLAYAAQGRPEQAIEALAEGIVRNPAAVAGVHWVPLVRPDGTAEYVLDPVYLGGSSPALERHILAHLGAPDRTKRVLAPSATGASTIALDDVLGAVEARYRRAASDGGRQAPLILAALAEASRLAGLDGRAESAYLEFQALQPGSAYGYRDLGVLYREQGRLEEAQAMLQRAVEASPRDVASRYQLALLYIDREMWAEAEQALAIVTSQSLTTLFHSRLFDPDLYVATARIRLAQGDVDGAIEARARAAVIRDLPEDHLALAALHRQAGRAQAATDACTAAAEALFRTWPRPLAPLLWEIGACLAQAPGDGVPGDITALARKQPLPGNVLVGHFYRARGEHEPALAAYQAAAEARPDQGDPHYFMGETYQALGWPDQAESEYRRAVELNPLESLPLLALGRLQWAQGRQDEALATFRAAVEATPGWGEAQVELGNALLSTDDRAGAAEHYRLAQLADGNVETRLGHDLAAELASAVIESGGGDHVRGTYATIDGRRQRVLFMHPNSRARYALQVPAGAELVFDVATLAESWGQAGDGVTFAVTVESSGSARQLFSTTIDPKRNDADRRWHSFRVDLADYAGQAVTLVLETSAGPAGNIEYDWAVWGRPRIQPTGSP